MEDNDKGQNGLFITQCGLLIDIVAFDYVIGNFLSYCKLFRVIPRSPPPFFSSFSFFFLWFGCCCFPSGFHLMLIRPAHLQCISAALHYFIITLFSDTFYFYKIIAVLWIWILHLVILRFRLFCD